METEMTSDCCLSGLGSNFSRIPLTHDVVYDIPNDEWSNPELLIQLTEGDSGAAAVRLPIRNHNDDYHVARHHQ